MGLLNSFKLFIRDVRVATEERGWSMPFGGLKLIFHFIFDYFLSLLARNVPSKLVPFFHRLRGVNIGKDVFIDKTVVIDEAYPENITIEDEVRVAAGSVLISHAKPGAYLRDHYLPTRVSKVKLCRYSFIGVNCVIMPGVTVGEGAVVVSGSSVITNVAPYTVVCGVPARKIKKLEKLNKIRGKENA